MTIRLLPCWHLGPWETMLGVWPVVGLEVAKALNTQRSLPSLLPRPAPPRSQWGKENLADSASPAGVGTPGTAARIGLLGQSKSGAGSCCQNGRDELGQEDPGRGRKHGGWGQSGVLQDGAWAPRGPSRQGRSGCHHPEGPGSKQPSDGTGAPGTGSWVGGLRTTALQAAALQ